MKLLTKNLIVTLVAAGANASTVYAATNVKDLQLNCQGHYKVLSATPYYNSHFSPMPKRYEQPPEAGAKEVIQITDIAGVDCAKLKTGYGLEVFAGQTLNYKVSAPGEASLQSAKLFAAEEIGKIHSFAVQQHFTYKTDKGNLPLFPLVHEEYAYLLNKSGKANAEILYGVPTFENLTDEQKLQTLEILYSQIDYGKIYASHYHGYADGWLNLVLAITPTGTEAALEYTSDLKNIFGNANQMESSFYTSQAGAAIGHKLNKMLNLLGSSKWQTKLQIVEQHPMLLDSQLVTWSQAGEALDLTASESEAFLSYALTQVQLLVKLPQLTEAVVLMNQYKNAASTLKAYSKQSTLTNYKYELSAQSLQLITEIQAIHFH